MDNEILIFGEIGWEVNLPYVVDQVKDTDPDKPLIVNIHSPGGSVFDGLAIYNYLKNLDREVHTVSTGTVASIASIIFLAGTKRTISETGQFLAHLPMTWADGNSEEIEKSLEQLKVFENQLADIYSAETKLTVEQALALMKEDDFSTIEYLQENGFVTDVVKLKAVASIKLNKQKENAMSKETVSVPKNMWAKINKIFNSAEPKNIIVNTADNGQLVFDRTEGEPQAGDKATFNGEDADKDYLLPNGDVLNFEGGELKTITKKEATGGEGKEGGSSDEDAMAQLLEVVKNTLKEELKPITDRLEKVENRGKTHATIMGQMKAIVSETAVETKTPAASTAAAGNGTEENLWEGLQ